MLSRRIQLPLRRSTSFISPSFIWDKVGRGRGVDGLFIVAVLILVGLRIVFVWSVGVLGIVRQKAAATSLTTLSQPSLQKKCWKTSGSSFRVVHLILSLFEDWRVQITVNHTSTGIQLGDVHSSETCSPLLELRWSILSSLSGCNSTKTVPQSWRYRNFCFEVNSHALGIRSTQFRQGLESKKSY